MIAVSDSGSADGTEATTTTAPTTAATPTVTPATAKPATTKTPKPTTATPKPQTTTAASKSTDNINSGSALGGGASLTSNSEATSASKKSVDDSEWDSNSSNNNSTDAVKTASVSGSGSVVTMELAIGIAGGVLAVVLLSAVFVIVMRRRRRSFDPDKLGGGDLSLNLSTGSSQQLPFQFSMSTASTNRAKNWNATLGFGATDTTIASTRSNLWEDEVIVSARIPKDKVVITTLFSRGGFGEVYRGIYNHQQVTIKILLPETRKDLKQINAFFVEVKLMAALEHEHIVHFIGVAWDSLNDVCVVSKFMEGGDLKGVLSVFQEQDRSLGFDHTKVKIALHIAHALTYMHSLQLIVLHRDLKSKNILLDSQMNAKLVDFGVSRERSDTTMTAAVGTSLWMAPEVMMGDRYDGKADVFSFGIALSELDSHAIPYGEVKESGSGGRIPDSAVLQMIALGKLQVEFSASATPEMVRLGNSCVSLDPKERPAMSEALYTLHTVLKSLESAFVVDNQSHSCMHRFLFVLFRTY